VSEPQNQNTITNVNYDESQQRVYNISQTGSIVGNIVNTGHIANNSITLDGETANLLDWLASQQCVSRDIALKKALATASYIYDLTNQGGKLLVQRKDNSVGEIILR
jgi:hypothetical protein